MQEASALNNYFEANGLKHHYWSWGREDLPVIMMLHGIRSYGKTWFDTAVALEDKYRVIALDMRGRGLSDWSRHADYFVDDYISDMEAFVAHLGVDKFILLGHSLGGQNALLYTAKYPKQVRALIIEDIGPGSSASGAGAQRIVREFNNTPSEFSSWEEAEAFWRSIRPNISGESLRQRILETLREDDRGKVVWAYDFAGIKAARLAAASDTSKLPELWPSVKSLRCPTLILRGAISDFLPSETLMAMASHNPVIETAEVSHATHYVHDDNFEEFLGYINAFMARLESEKEGQSETC